MSWRKRVIEPRGAPGVIQPGDDLTPAELERLTGAKSPRRQVAVLWTLGVPFRAGARVISVSRAVAEQLPIWQAKADAKPRLDLVR